MQECGKKRNFEKIVNAIFEKQKSGIFQSILLLFKRDSHSCSISKSVKC